MHGGVSFTLDHRKTQDIITGNSLSENVLIITCSTDELMNDQSLVTALFLCKHSWCDVLTSYTSTSLLRIMLLQAEILSYFTAVSSG